MRKFHSTSSSPNTGISAGQQYVEAIHEDAMPAADRGLDLRHTIFNAAAFQGAWFDLIIFHSGIALLFICVLALQLWRLFAENIRYMVLPLIAVFCAGLILDSSLSSLELFKFEESSSVSSVIPEWLVMLWLAFVLSLPVSFAWLLHKPSLAIGVFACMAPLSYIAGRSFGVIEFSNWTIIFISMAWALVAYISCRWVGQAIRKKSELVKDMDQLS